MNSQTSPEKTNHQIKSKISPWSPPENFSVTKKEEPIFLVDNYSSTRNKQTPQPFSLTPMNIEESMALSAWEDEDTDMREENSVEIFMDKNSNSSYCYSSDNTVNIYDDDTASVTTCSTTTTTTSDYPSVVHVTLEDLIKLQERRNSMQNNINNYNKSINDKTSSVISKGKQKIVNFQDEVVKSPGESSKNSVDLAPLAPSSTISTVSNDSSTVKDNNSLQEEISELSIPPSLGLTKLSRQEFNDAKIDKQNKLRGWVKCLWPQPRLPGTRQLSAGLNSRSLLKRKLNPLIIGVITMQNKTVPMVSTVIVKGTEHINDEIGKNGQIRFTGKPVIITGVYDPREYLLLHCPTFHNPPACNGDPRIPWNEQFLLNKVLPRLCIEVTRVQNEVGLFLTVKETLLRGLEKYSLYECKFCRSNLYNRIIRTYTYSEIYDHLLSNKHGVKKVNDEEMIGIHLREYIYAFYENLPPRIFERFERYH